MAAPAPPRTPWMKANTVPWGRFWMRKVRLILLARRVTWTIRACVRPWPDWPAGSKSDEKGHLEGVIAHPGRGRVAGVDRGSAPLFGGGQRSSVGDRRRVSVLERHHFVGVRLAQQFAQQGVVQSVTGLVAHEFANQAVAQLIQVADGVQHLVL